ncbi:MAG: pyruvate:ferredoxin (flavodoxin) oxidoreductase [candidate division KSB1 bacterium]|nr:pyruvate:ferredoxin (flavodoxin) oxidoreductase [candidate division KSB1 bacterium]MDZ7384703.1 pyruvate:ferredoxin (flavodoxin) oxidoreductase [candidate division KSB1 bacterium]MDZ7392272.1 pyruvate:ferredoxin (flavodoxin) oxidoreductase [candidate division KSB1 bacterium]
MKRFEKASMDGNTAAAHVAYAFSEVAAIYPITPSSPMGELADEWASKGRKNIFGQVVDVIEMQSEAGAAGAVHGSLSAGAFTTTFTASQGLMLMLPNMHKIAGEMLPTVFHVSARSLACQSLSIFGDHSDVMAARNTGFALMAAASIQEIMDLAVVSHLATLKSKVPFLNFFDGFRSSHEIQKIEVIDYDTMREMLDWRYVEEFRKRALNPERPFVKVGAENPDVYFQGRETVNKYYQACPAIVQEYMDLLAKHTGRQYHLFDYVGAPDADKVIVAMASGCETIEETINYLNAKRGTKLGLVKVRLFRPFAAEEFAKVVPKSVRKIAVLDRTKEPGSVGEPLYLDVVAALKHRPDITIIGGRYGLSSKEFTPSMVKAVYDHLDNKCTHGFTVGITDDVTFTSIPITERLNTVPEGTISCKFWGLGADGTVGANKNSIKIIGDNTDMYAQGYFQYDSKKSGGITRSHLRFGHSPIQSAYLVEDADFIACHNQAFIGRYDVLEGIKEGGVFLLNSNWSREEAFENLTEDMQRTIIEKKVKFYNIDALRIAEEVGLGRRINTVMQAAFFIISRVLPRDTAIAMIKEAIKKTYGKRGEELVKMNWEAVDRAAAALQEVPVPATLPKKHMEPKKLIPDDADDFTKNVIEPIMREKGDQIPVSQMPFDGSMRSGTTALEKRGIAPYVPHWIPENCIQCNQCSFVCPHAAIRAKLIDRTLLGNAPSTFKTLRATGKDGEKYDYKVQVFVEDCVGCLNCVNECPKQALVAKTIEEERAAGENDNVAFFTSLPENVLSTVVKETTVKGSQFRQPLLEFSGACAGCGETPYVRLLTQLFGERMIIANATGCSSIWGGTFPSIPYTKTPEGYGPAWANSLFEDNAEYGFGMRLAVDANRRLLRSYVEQALSMGVDGQLRGALLKAQELWEDTSAAAMDNARLIKSLLPEAIARAGEEAKTLLTRIRELDTYFVDKSIWAIGGDGWAYDIGYGGLDHVMAAGRNVNLLVLDTEVYSNTGGQASKATPLGSVARFAESGKPTKKKDLGLMMMSYGYVYVASVAMGANKNQLLKALVEAEAYKGPSIIIAYAPCINHGIDMAFTQLEEKKAVDSGYWVLYRYNPLLKKEGKNPFILDSKEPQIPVQEFLQGEKRYSSLKISFPEKAQTYWPQFQEVVKERYAFYKKLAE